MDKLDLSTLDPGVRDFVAYLRAHNFNTTDSGDGIAKLDIDGEEYVVLPWPHVFIRVEDPYAMIEEADRLYEVMRSGGIDVEPGDIQASFDPVQERIGVIALVDDEDRYIRKFKWVAN